MAEGVRQEPNTALAVSSHAFLPFNHVVLLAKIWKGWLESWRKRLFRRIRMMVSIELRRDRAGCEADEQGGRDVESNGGDDGGTDGWTGGGTGGGTRGGCDNGDGCDGHHGWSGAR